jgi:hypothetical protein
MSASSTRSGSLGLRSSPCWWRSSQRSGQQAKCRRIADSPVECFALAFGAGQNPDLVLLISLCPVLHRKIAGAVSHSAVEGAPWIMDPGMPKAHLMFEPKM